MTVSEQQEAAVAVSPKSWAEKLQAVASSQVVGWLALTCVFVALPLFYIKFARLADPDIWWHMRAGEWIVQNHRIPHVDPFSATTMGKPWIDYNWLFDLGSYWVVSQFDLASIVWFETLMRIGVTAGLFSLLRTVTSNFWKALGLTALAMLAMAWVLPPRPGAISVLFFLLELHVLVSAQRKANPRLLWIIPAIFVLWANIHIEFVTGLFMLGIFCLEPLARKLVEMSRGLRTPVDEYTRQLWMTGIASGVAVMLNPYGPYLLTSAFNYARDTKIYDVIVEFHAMHFRSMNDWAVLALLMLACFSLGRSRQFRYAWSILLAWAAWMGFRSLREVWLVAILSAVIIASARGDEEQASEKIVRTSPGMRLAVGATVFVVLIVGASYWSLSSKKLLQQVSEIYPLGAVGYIHQNHLQGPLLNELSWGGFLIYAAPEIPVSLDGRTNVHSQDEILHSFPLWNGEAGWQNRPELQHANLIVSNHEWPLALLLRSDPRFRIAYEDRTAVLFQAVHPEPIAAPAAAHKP